MSTPHFMMIPGAPAPVAPFSHAVEVDGWVFLTGQMPTDPNDDGAPLNSPACSVCPSPFAKWRRATSDRSSRWR